MASKITAQRYVTVLLLLLLLLLLFPRVQCPQKFNSIMIIFKKWANPGLFFVYFCLFNKTLQFLQKINVKKCPSSFRRRDLNSQPSDYKSPPLTTYQGSSPFNYDVSSQATNGKRNSGYSL